MAFKQSLVSAVRPRKYFTIPREWLEASLEDAEQLMNFFVIESQRILFAENAFVTFAVSADLGFRSGMLVLQYSTIQYCCLPFLAWGPQICSLSPY